MREIYPDINQDGIESAVVCAPFDQGQKVLESKGYKIISLGKNAGLRIQQGKDSHISKNGNWTREGVIWIPKETPKLVRHSPILYSAEQATRAHMQGKEFYPSREQLDEALAGSIDFPNKYIEIPTNRFNSEPLTCWAFEGEKEAEAYGEFLREAGIKRMPVYAVDKDYVDRQNQPFTRQVWFWCLGWSELDGSDGGHLGDGLRGVKESDLVSVLNNAQETEQVESKRKINPRPQVSEEELDSRIRNTIREKGYLSDGKVIDMTLAQYLNYLKME